FLCPIYQLNKTQVRDSPFLCPFYQLNQTQFRGSPFLCPIYQLNKTQSHDLSFLCLIYQPATSSSRPAYPIGAMHFAVLSKSNYTIDIYCYYTRASISCTKSTISGLLTCASAPTLSPLW